MTAVAASSLAVAPDGGYAPDFLVKVEGQPMDDTTKNDVLSIQVTRDIDNMASFDLTFDNFRTIRRCRLIWREGDFLGLAFEN